MKPELRRVGSGNSPVVVIDGFSGDPGAIVELAARLAPFPAVKGNYYPGLRRIIARDDGAADDYATRTCRDIAPFVAGAFDFDRFDLIEASFSIVTTAPDALTPPQRAPHFDTTDPHHLAVLHYLNVPADSGTAFYRQRSTGIERLTEDNVATFVAAAEQEAAMLAPASGYIQGSDPFFEQTGMIEAVPDRLLIYQGSLLHSGIIPQAMNFSPDPRVGRLTANLFILGHMN